MIQYIKKYKTTCIRKSPLFRIKSGNFTYLPMHAANPDRVAVPLSGPGGKIAVLELKKTGRLPDGVMPALVHGATVMDFQWDPFDNQRLAVGKVQKLKIYNKENYIIPSNLKSTIIEFACASL